MKSVVERETKLDAGPAFVLPDLEPVADGLVVVSRDPQRLVATYFDTDDLRLARHGVTLRYRTGEDAEGWTLKLPRRSDEDELARRELTFDAPPGTPPTEVVAIVRGIGGGRQLQVVGELVTVRRRVQLFDGEANVVVEVADDDVSVLEGTRILSRFREVEIEHDGSAPKIAAAVVSAVRQAGAKRGQGVAKIVRALGDRAIQPADETVSSPARDASVREIVAAACGAAAARLLAHDPGVRLGDDPEDVHQARVATRRLRSDLRTFAPVLDADWTARLRDELRWLAGSLGAVRDTDVLLGRLESHVASLDDEDRDPAKRLIARLRVERERVRSALMEDMDSDRYVQLAQALVDAARSPGVSRREADSAADVLPDLLVRPWRHLAAAVGALGDSPNDDALHEVRIRAKRTRYAAEAVAPVIGGPARRLAAGVAGLQEVLGDFNDAVVAERWLRSTAAKAGGRQALVAGQLVAIERAAAAEGRARWKKAWKRASEKKLRSWIPT